MNLLNSSLTEFSTPRLVCRRGEPAFAGALYAAARESIETVYPFLPWCHPEYKMADAVGWLESCVQEWENGQYSFAIFDHQDTLLGGCGFTKIDQHPVANLGYWLRTSATGKGFATEATLGLANFAFSSVGIRRLEIIMATHNPASRQVAIKAGAEFEGTLRSRIELHGKMHDAYLYSLISD